MIDLINSKEELNNVLFVARYGSFNYNIQSDNSDIDWRGFVLNNIDSEYSANFKIDNHDICIDGIYQFYDYLKSKTPKFIELLFSDCIVFNGNLNSNIRDLLNEIFNMKNEIVTADLEHLFHSYMRNYEFQLTNYKISKFPLKYAYHAYRILDILDRFEKTNFEDFNYAIRYSIDDSSRDIVINLKNGNLDNFDNIIKDKFDKVNDLKESYKDRINHESYSKLKRIIQDIIKEGRAYYQ